MKKVWARCRRCKHEFQVQILSQEEVSDPRNRPGRVRCKKCGRTDVET